MASLVARRAAPLPALLRGLPLFGAGWHSREGCFGDASRRLHDAASQQPLRSASTFASGFSMPMPKRLEEIMPVQELELMAVSEIPKRWNDFHIGRTHISTTMSTADYGLFGFRSQKCPMLVLPVPKPKGFVTMFSQGWPNHIPTCRARAPNINLSNDFYLTLSPVEPQNGNRTVLHHKSPHILMTGLEDFRVRGNAAAPYLTITHYTDIADSKGIVLVRGDVVLPGKLADTEAKWLLEKVHQFYIRDDLYKLVEGFNRNSPDFDFKDLVKAAGVNAIW